MPHDDQLPLSRPWQRIAIKTTSWLNFSLTTSDISLLDFCQELRELADSLQQQFDPNTVDQPTEAEVITVLNPKPGDPVAWVGGDPIYDLPIINYLNNL